MASKIWADGPFPLIATSKTTKKKGDPTAIWLGDDMAHVHNVFIRELNSMYLQAPYVKLHDDQLDLCQYAIYFYDLLHHHHHVEETGFFPDVERITGVKGIMEQNVEQHHAFTPALETFGQYVKDCQSKKKSFDAKEFAGLIDAFAPALSAHLKDEVDSLYALGEYDTKAVKKSYMAFGAEAMKQDKSTAFPLACGSRDVTYEGGCSWPDFPFFVPFMIDWVYAGKHRSVWRFNPCTIRGRPQPLHFLPNEK